MGHRIPFKPEILVPEKEIPVWYGLHFPDPNVPSAFEVAKPYLSFFFRNNSTTDEISEKRYGEILRAADDSSGNDDGTIHRRLDRLVLAPMSAEPPDVAQWSEQGRHLMIEEPIENDSIKPRIEIHTVLRSSNWYKELSSSQQQIADEQLAILLDELNRFHANPIANKRLNTQFIKQNVHLQQMLSHLGVYVTCKGMLEPDMRQEINFHLQSQEQQQLQEQLQPQGQQPQQALSFNPNQMQAPPTITPWAKYSQPIFRWWKK